MWRRAFVQLLSFVLVRSVGAVSLPNYIKSCSRNDPNLNACALQSATESIHTFSLGDTNRNLDSLDPLLIDEMVIFVPNKNGLKVVLKDNYFTGFSNLHMEDLRFDLSKRLIEADCLVTLTIQSKYELSGKILVVPVASNGDSVIKLKNTLLRIRIWYDHVEGEDGKTHWKIQRHDMRYEMEKATFRLENLLGDKSIGDQINRLLNELWREIIADIGPMISKHLMDAVIKNISILLAQVSYDELMPE